MGSDRLYKEIMMKLRMTEGRHCQVVLLDDRRLEILVKPKLYAGELLDMVASHFSIKEKEYFGLAFVDDTGHYNWLQLDRRVLEHEFPKKASQNLFILHFLVKYFVESITQLRDAATVEAFYLQAQLLVFKGTVEVDCDTSFHLAALVLQATHGDYVDDKTTKEQLKKLPVLPTSVLKEHPSLPVCEEQVIGHYCKISGQSRGIAIVNYMTVVESLPTYGVHYYEVKDKSGMPWWLGISFKGISQYDHSDRKTPRKMFLWKQLENLYFRDRKFSMEVHDIQKLPSSRRTFGPGNVTVYIWFSISPILTKSIWSMAVSQHQFYLDRKHGKSLSPVARNLGDIASELSRSIHSLSSSDSPTNLSRSASSHSLPALKLDNELNEETKAAFTEMMSILKTQKIMLEESLQKKLKELKVLCFKEGELTGQLPPETPVDTIIDNTDTKNVNSLLVIADSQNQDDEISKLETDYEIQNRLVKVAFKLVSDSRATKTIHRQRKISYQHAQSKLKQIESQLLVKRKQKEDLEKDDEQVNEDPLFQDSGVNLSSACLNQSIIKIQDPESPSINQLCLTPVTSSSHLSVSPHKITSGCSSAPPSPTKYRHLHNTSNSLSSRPSTPSSVNSSRAWNQSLSGQGYTPNSVYQTRYRNQQYPILSTYYAGSDSSNGSALSLKSPYQNKFESTLNIEGSNLYSVPTQRTSQAFDSQDDILASLPSDTQNFGLMSRHNSLDSSRRHSYHRYLQQLNSSSESKTQIKSPVNSPPSYNKHMSFSVDDRNSTKCDHQGLPQHYHQHYLSSLHCVHHHHHHHHHTHFPSSSSSLLSNSDCLSNLQQNSIYLAAAKQQYINHVCHTNPTVQIPASNSCTEKMYISSNSFQYLTGNAPVGTDVRTSTYKMGSMVVSPRSKTKIWTETSLDSPIPSQKYKSPTPRICSKKVETSSPIFPPSNTEDLPEMGSHKLYIPTSLSGQSLCHISQRHTSIILPGHFQPYWEETKPYEISDFYKYSVKHRKHLQQENEKKIVDVSDHSKHNSTKSVSKWPSYEQSESSISDLSDSRFSSNEEPSASVADAFHEEMLAWYQDHENTNKATLV